MKDDAAWDRKEREQIEEEIGCLNKEIEYAKNNPEQQREWDCILLYLSYILVDTYAYYENGGEYPDLYLPNIIDILRRCADAVEFSIRKSK